MAMEVKEVRGGSLSKEELAQEVSKLKKRLSEGDLHLKEIRKQDLRPDKTQRRILSVITAEREDIWLESAEGDISGKMILTQQQDRNTQCKLRARE